MASIRSAEDIRCNDALPHAAAFERDRLDDIAIFDGLAFEHRSASVTTEQRPKGSVAKRFGIDKSNLYERAS